MVATTPRNSIPYPQQGDSPNQATAMANLVGQVDRRMVPRFTNTTDRTTRVPSPSEGMIGYLASADEYQIYRAGAWVKLAFAKTVVKTVDTVRTLQGTPTADPELQISGIQSGRTYLLEAVLLTNGDTGIDMKINFGGPTAAGNIYWILLGSGATNSSNTVMSLGSLSGETMATPTTLNVGTAGTNLGPATLRGTFTTSASGTFSLNWAQGTASALPITLLAGSYFSVTAVV